MTDLAEYERRLVVLRQRFVNRLGERRDEIEALIACLQAGPDSVALETLHRKLHDLSGSSATFGFEELGRRARVLEAVCEDLSPQVQVGQDFVQAVKEFSLYLQGLITPPS